MLSIALFASTLIATEPQMSRAPSTEDTQVAVMCFKKSENTSGMNKMCFYDCLGSTVAINIKTYELCPLTIDN